MKLHDMKQSKAERNRDLIGSDSDDYPHDVKAHFTHETLEKMGAPDKVKAGDLHRVEGHFRVNHVSEESDGKGKTRRAVHGHFEQMGMTRMRDEPDRGKLRESIVESSQKADAKRDAGPAREQNKPGKD